MHPQAPGMHNKLFLSLFFFFSVQIAKAQNLPSLLTDRNINSTFSIIAFDPQSMEWGIAVATNNIYVGNSTCYIEPGLGAFSVIAETDPAYAVNGFRQLRDGRTIEQAINYTKSKDSMADYRQVSGIDAKGNVYAFTGSTLKYWKGNSTHITGKNFAVMGNQLAAGTLKNMADAFEQGKGTLAERLLSALVAGEQAGGQINGKQSAALLVKGTNNEWYNNIDLRVDHSRQPFSDLQRLLNYHQGRIRLNQATFALSKGNKERAYSLLNQAVSMTNGWYGIYPKLAKAYLLFGEEDKAAELINATVKAEPKWKENLSAFYCLYNKHPEIRSLLPENKFDAVDWNNAISMLISLGRYEQAISLAEKTLQKYPAFSYTWYLQALAYQKSGNPAAALNACNKALVLDPDNEDAKRLSRLLDH